ncbi:MAG: type II secretion system F family protein [Bacilli bacterium]
MFKKLLLPFNYFLVGLLVVGKNFVLGAQISGAFFIKILSYLGDIFKQFLILLGKIIKVFFFYTLSGLRMFLKYIFILFKIIAFYLGEMLKLLFKVLIFIFQKIVLGIETILNFLYFLLKKLFLLVISLLKILQKGLIKVFKFLTSLPLLLWHGLKWLGKIIYIIFISPFVFVGKFFQRLYVSLIDSLTTLFEKLKEKAKELKNLPKKIQKGLSNWFNNLSFIKDMRNRREMKRQALLIDFEAEEEVRSEEKVLYRFVGKNPDGKIEKGKLSAYSRLDVHSYLLAEGYEVYEIEPFKGLNIALGSNLKIKPAELVFLLTQLSTYIKSGIPLVDSIKILSKQSKRADKVYLFRSIIYELTMGESFSEALAKQGKVFPRLLVNMIKSAELAGNLPETLDSMADYYDSVNKTRKQMITAMMYPTVVFLFATIIIAFILLFVIPEFVTIYKDMGSELPAITRFTVGVSDYLQNNIIFIILGVIVFVVSVTMIYSNIKVFKMLIQWILMHLPVVGKIIIYNEVTMFSKTFGSLLNHNVFITDSMEILSKITNNEIYKMLIFDTITNLAKGESISKSFKNHWAFPIVAYEMLLTGERTGQPGPMMDKVANYYQEEHRNAVNQVKVFIEPVMIVALTVIVGFILLSVILPMFSLYGNLG